jgi:hypothetical protein
MYIGIVCTFYAHNYNDFSQEVHLIILGVIYTFKYLHTHMV